MNRTGEFTYKDYRGGMPPRAFGSETEFTDTSELADVNMNYQEFLHHGVQEPPSIQSLLNNDYFVSATSTHSNDDVITVNGGRLYLDGEVIEYATPECRTPEELVLHERAGEIMARDVAEQAGFALGSETPIKIFKRSGYAKVLLPNSDQVVIAEGSAGNHENYTSLNEFSLFDPSERVKKLELSRNAKHFSDYLALRKLIDGVGMVDVDGFSITQRPHAVNFRRFGDPTKHGKKRAFCQWGDRMEVRSGEGNKSDWATEFKFGLTSLVLRLIEHDAFPHHLELGNPELAVKTLAHDPLGCVMLTSGEKLRGIDMLNDIVNAAVDLSISYPDSPQYEQKAAGDFYKFYNDLERVSLRDHEVSALSDRIDWAARFAYLIGRGATYNTIKTTNLGYVRDDLKWDQLTDRDIARRHFNKFGHTALCAIVPGPPHTRAKQRVRIMRDLHNNSNLRAMDWNEILSQDHRHFFMPNPLDASDVTGIDYRYQ